VFSRLGVFVFFCFPLIFPNFLQNFGFSVARAAHRMKNAHKLVANSVTFHRWAAPHPSVLLAVVWSLDVVSFWHSQLEKWTRVPVFVHNAI
jgi:hypothetical protein